MDKGIQQLFSIGFKYKSGQWEIRKINITLDPGNNFHPVWPVNVPWPDGINGSFFKESVSGKCFYKEV